MSKNIITVAITIIFLQFLPIINLYSQDYGTELSNANPNATNRDGFRPPLTRKEERIRAKARRLSLTQKDILVLNKKEKGKSLKFGENFRYPFAKRKRRKLDKLQDNYDKQNKSNQDSVPGYLETSRSNELTIEEKEIIKKVEQDSSELTKQEKKIYKKAQKKQKRAKKEKSQYKYETITETETHLLSKSKQMPDSLSKSDKRNLKKIKKKQKKNKKTKEKVHQFYVDSALATGAPMPVGKKKFRLPKISFKKKGSRPSRYLKKQRRIERRYTPNEKEKEAMRMYKGGVKVNGTTKQRAQRGERKKWLLKTKMNKHYKKQFMKNQLKSTRKQIRKREKDSKKRHKNRQKQHKNTKQLNLFRKKK